MRQVQLLDVEAVKPGQRVQSTEPSFIISRISLGQKGMSALTVLASPLVTHQSLLDPQRSCLQQTP